MYVFRASRVTPGFCPNSSVAHQACIHFLPAESHSSSSPSPPLDYTDTSCIPTQGIFFTSLYASQSLASLLFLFPVTAPILPTLPTVAAHHPLDPSPSGQPLLGVQEDCLLCLCSPTALPGTYCDHCHLSYLIIFLCICIPQWPVVKPKLSSS